MFQASCEAAALAWDVPALAVGISVGGDGRDGRRRLRSDDALSGRVDHEAVHGHPRARAARSRKPRPGSGPRTSGSGTCSRTRAASTASCPSVTRPGSATATTRSRPPLPSSPVGAAIPRASSRPGRMRTPATGSPATCALERPERPSRRRCERRDPAARGPRGDVVRRARARRHRPRRPGRSVPPRAPAVRRPRLERRRPAALRRAGTSRSPTRRGCASRTAKPTAGVYGLGLFGERVGGVEVWGHGGSYGGFQSSLLLVPDRGAVFAGLTNGSHGAQGAVRPRGLRSSSDVLGARRARAPSRSICRKPSATSFAGSYANSDGRYEVDARARRASSSPLDGDEYPARAIGERTFEVTEGDAIRDRFDFPLEGFGRFGSRLAERVA